MKLYKDNADRYCLADSLGDAAATLDRGVYLERQQREDWLIESMQGASKKRQAMLRGYYNKLPPIISLTKAELVTDHVYTDKAPALATGWPPVKEDV